MEPIILLFLSEKADLLLCLITYYFIYIYFNISNFCSLSSKLILINLYIYVNILNIHYENIFLNCSCDNVKQIILLDYLLLLYCLLDKLDLYEGDNCNYFYCLF
jgi:hypothetical protein